jgi:hypothetical protein
MLHPGLPQFRPLRQRPTTRLDVHACLLPLLPYTHRSTKPEEAPTIVRSCLTLLGCVAAATHKLPPLETADNRLWAPTALMFGLHMDRDPVAAVSSLRGRLSDSASESALSHDTSDVLDYVHYY